MRGWMLLCLAIAVAVLFWGCGGSSASSTSAETQPRSPRKIRVSLDSTEGAENVGILMAVKRGYFEDVGLDVWEGSPLEPDRPLSYVAKGTDDFGVTQMPQVVRGREEGLGVTAVGSLVAHPTAAMIWLKGADIRQVTDLKGKTIAYPGVPFQKAFLESVLARAGLGLDDVRLENVGYELVPALIGGQADAIFGAAPNLVAPEIEAEGATPVVVGVRDLGIPDYEEDVVIARTDLVERDPQMVGDFMSAVRRGTEAAVEDPEAAVQAIVDAIGASPELHRREKTMQVKATLPLLSRSGRMSPARAEALVDWMYEEGIVKRRWAADEVLAKPSS
jgi:putative hydroxymethylpyrimidine transport system substrate-binding protein